MFGDRVYIYISDQVEVVSANLQSSIKPANKENIHNVRVAIKKINTICKYIDLNLKKSGVRKIFKKEIRPIFRHVGKIRNSQIQLELLSEYQGNSKVGLLKKYISKRLEKESNKLYDKTLLWDNPFNELLKEIEINKKVINDISIDTFLTGICKKVKKTRKRITAGKLHLQRKLSKDYRYFSEFLMGDSFSTGSDERMLKIKKMEEILGNWHDLHELKKRCFHFLYKKAIRNKTKKEVKKLIDYISRDIITELENYMKISDEYFCLLKSEIE